MVGEDALTLTGPPGIGARAGRADRSGTRGGCYTHYVCGRYALGLTSREIEMRFGIAEIDQRRPPVFPIPLPLFNVGPGRAIPVVVASDEGRSVRAMRWGFKPSWSKDKGRPAPINARAETLVERPMFRGAVAKGRCVIPASGFYEWQSAVGQRGKQPWHFRLTGGEPFGFAGLWTPGPDGQDTAAIITTSANELVGQVHDRMPVILAPDDEGDWLDIGEGPSAVLGCLRPFPAEMMEGYPVSPAVNAVANDGPELARPLS